MNYQSSLSKTIIKIKFIGSFLLFIKNSKKNLIRSFNLFSLIVNSLELFYTKTPSDNFSLLGNYNTNKTITIFSSIFGIILIILSITLFMIYIFDISFLKSKLIYRNKKKNFHRLSKERERFSYLVCKIL